MGISAYHSLNYLNDYNSSLFNSSTSNTSNSINSLYSLTSGANYYKTIAKYAIESKYGVNQATSNSSSHSTSKTSTQFLSDFDSNYSSLKSATANLKSAVSKDNTNSSDIDATVAATQTFVKAYNSTSNFLSDHSSTSTYRLNGLKNSLTNVSSSNSDTLSIIGITRNNDSSLALDASKLKTALTDDPNSVARTLNRVTIHTEMSTSMATNTSKLRLINEQVVASSTSNSNSTDDNSYKEFLAMSKNSTKLRNYYYSLASLGIFMDISI